VLAAIPCWTYPNLADTAQVWLPVALHPDITHASAVVKVFGWGAQLVTTYVFAQDRGRRA
jgi:hypothetical protein